MAECLPRVHAEDERSTPPPPPPAPPALAKPKPSRPSSSKSRSQREKDEEIEESLQRLKNQGKYVKLNVGGSLHYTTLGTLTKHDNMLRAMFSERIPLQTDDEGEWCVCVITCMSVDYICIIVYSENHTSDCVSHVCEEVLFVAVLSIRLPLCCLQHSRMGID